MTEKHIAVLIDLDRAKSANKLVEPIDYCLDYSKIKSSCVAQELDWNQVGIMAQTVMGSTKSI